MVKNSETDEEKSECAWMGKVSLIMYKKGFLLPLKLEIRANSQQIVSLYPEDYYRSLKCVNSSLFQYVRQLLYGPREKNI